MLDFFDYQRPDNQAQDLKYQINQCLSEILIVTIGTIQDDLICILHFTCRAGGRHAENHA
jgi:hypothetical protein